MALPVSCTTVKRTPSRMTSARSGSRERNVARRCFPNTPPAGAPELRLRRGVAGLSSPGVHHDIGCGDLVPHPCGQVTSPLRDVGIGEQ
ncbi:phosphodiesterase, MJ0936 family domain protein [Mycobacterium xenopi 3993]|nr:phosphodiesterase, MJ0936 family domain protein [Mycobacterium xenopi 3993]